MKKAAIILSGAVMFDLGVMIVPSHAATGPDAQSRAPGQSSVDTKHRKVADTKDQKASGLKIEMSDVLVSSYTYLKFDRFLKIDGVDGIKACAVKEGTVVQRDGQPQCQVTDKSSPIRR